VHLFVSQYSGEFDVYSGYFTPESVAAWIHRMLKISILSLIPMHIPIILFSPCYPPMITCQLYDRDGPGSSTLVGDYLELTLIGGINAFSFGKIC